MDFVVALLAESGGGIGVDGHVAAVVCLVGMSVSLSFIRSGLILVHRKIGKAGRQGDGLCPRLTDAGVIEKRGRGGLPFHAKEMPLLDQRQKMQSRYHDTDIADVCLVWFGADPGKIGWLSRGTL